MDIEAKRKTVAILKVLHKFGQPMGSAAISRELQHWGIDLRERMVRYYLELTDQQGWTRNLGRRGRVLTDAGRAEIDIGVAFDRVGFVAARMDELAYNMSFDLPAMTGTLIVNTSFVPLKHHDVALREIHDVIHSNLGIGRFVKIDPPATLVHGLQVPDDSFAVSTVCSVVLNGILLRHGITMTSRYGGLLEISDHKPLRFSQIISYDGSTLDPLVTFIKGRMTNIRAAVNTGTGTIGASFREIPTAALPAAQEIIADMNNKGLGGVLQIGKPNQPLLDIPVGYGRVGIIVAGGLNPLGALEEMGIDTNNRAMHELCPLAELTPIEKLMTA